MLCVSRVFRQQGIFASTLLGGARLNDLALINHFSSLLEQQQQSSAASSAAAFNRSSGLTPKQAIAQVYAPQAGTGFVSLDSLPHLHSTAAGKVSGSCTVIANTPKRGEALRCFAPVTVEGAADKEAKPSLSWTEVTVPSSQWKPLGNNGETLRCAVVIDKTSAVQSKQVALDAAVSVEDKCRAELWDKRTKVCRVLSGIVSMVEGELARYAAGSSRYDQLLVYHQQVQSIIAQLRCTAFAVETVSLASEAVEAGGDATLALMTATAHTAAVLRDVERLVTPHATRSNVDYSFLNSACQLSSELRILDGPRASLSQSVVEDLLSLPSLARFVPNPILGSRGPAVRLTSQHLNLTFAAKQVEEDVLTFLEVVAKVQQNSATKASAATTPTAAAASSVLASVDSPSYEMYCAEFLSEVYATVAVLCRSTASLTMDEEGQGQSDSLLAQGFSYMSKVRRARVLHHLRQDAATRTKVWPQVKEKDYDEFAVHPVEASMSV